MLINIFHKGVFKIKKEVEIIYNLLFSYVNKDEEFPHDFEIKSIEEGLRYLECNTKDIDKINFAKQVLEDIKSRK